MLSIIGFRWDRNDTIQMYTFRIVKNDISNREQTAYKGYIYIKTWLIRGIVNQNETGTKLT